MTENETRAHFGALRAALAQGEAGEVAALQIGVTLLEGFLVNVAKIAEAQTHLASNDRQRLFEAAS